MSTYYIKYVMYPWETEQGIEAHAKSKAKAYDIAVNELIPAKHDGHYPYSAWVESVTYNNGNVRQFNNGDGHAY